MPSNRLGFGFLQGKTNIGGIVEPLALTNTSIVIHFTLSPQKLFPGPNKELTLE